MLGLILTIGIGLAIAYFSIHGTQRIEITLGNSTYVNIPLFVVTVGSYLLGIVLAWIIEVPQSIATTFEMMGLGRTIKSGNTTIAKLQNKINSLEVENAKLQEQKKSILANKNTNVNYFPNRIHNFLHRLNQR